LVKILADEVDAELHVLDGAMVKGGMWRGSGSSLVRKLFRTARKTNKHSIIMIDEFDEIGTSSYGCTDTGGMKTLLTQMDGFNDEGSDRITVIGLTNRPDKLTPAMRRRFNLMQISLPDDSKRKEFFKFYFNKVMKSSKGLKNYVEEENIDFTSFAGDLTEGFSQDRIKQVVNNVFLNWTDRVAGCKLNDGLLDLGKEKFMVTSKEFEIEIKKMDEQIGAGQRNFLLAEHI